MEILISGDFGKWHMRFDLGFIVSNLGVKKDGLTVMKIPQARRIMRLIVGRADTVNFAKADEFISACSNTKAKEIWADEKRKYGDSVYRD